MVSSLELDWGDRRFHVYEQFQRARCAPLFTAAPTRELQATCCELMSVSKMRHRLNNISLKDGVEALVEKNNKCNEPDFPRTGGQSRKASSRHLVQAAAGLQATRLQDARAVTGKPRSAQDDRAAAIAGEPQHRNRQESPSTEREEHNFADCILRPFGSTCAVNPSSMPGCENEQRTAWAFGIFAPFPGIG